MQVDNFRLLVNDFAASLHFWQQVVGLPLLFKDEAGETYAYFQADGVRIELLRANYFAVALGATEPVLTQTGYRGAVVFKTDDVDATFAELVERGATVLAPPQDRPEWHCRAAHLAAPDGYVIELFKTLGTFPVSA